MVETEFGKMYDLQLDLDMLLLRTRLTAAVESSWIFTTYNGLGITGVHSVDHACEFVCIFYRLRDDATFLNVDTGVQGL